jgi:hypothetical protein
MPREMSSRNIAGIARLVSSSRFPTRPQGGYKPSAAHRLNPLKHEAHAKTKDNPDDDEPWHQSRHIAGRTGEPEN